MEKYDYEKAVKDDIKEYLKDHGIGYIDKDLRQKLEEDMFVCDSVTGNGSGSYTFNAWRAEENLCHNFDLMSQCRDHFEMEVMDLSKGAEHWDVSIRCYLLNQCFTEVIKEWNAKHPEEGDDEDEDENDK